MDELEWLRRNSATARPSPETTRRHRTQLRAAIAEEGAAGTPPARRARPRHRVLLGATAVVALTALVAVVVTLAGSGDDTGRHVATPAADTTGPASGAPACGRTLPAEVALPDGFGAPQAASAAAADTPASASQLVETWASPTATLELRWPSDADKRPWAGQPADSGRAFDAQADAAASSAKSGSARRTILFRFPDQPKGCDTVQVTVYSADEATVSSVFDQYVQQPFVTKDPTVATNSAARSLPSVVACPAVKGAAATTVRGGPVSTAGFATPEAALTSFVGDRERHLLPTDYAELQLPDGSRGYVQTTPAGVVTTVLVTQATGQWSVARWEASPC